MNRIGLEAHTQNFTLNYPLGGGKVNHPSSAFCQSFFNVSSRLQVFKGKNIYGILRAPRIGSTESIVITVPYRSPDSIHTQITHGIPLILAFAEFAKSINYSQIHLSMTNL
jgi:GPI-anchor transamidase subunit GAA1